jgi:hypothetical protein
MGIEAYFAIPDDGPRRPVGDYVRRLAEAGFPCREQPDEWGHWIVFDGLDATLNVSVEDGAAIFVTLDLPYDASEAFETIERVFAEAGWITGPDEYE